MPHCKRCRKLRPLNAATGLCETCSYFISQPQIANVAATDAENTRQDQHVVPSEKPAGSAKVLQKRQDAELLAASRQLAGIRTALKKREKELAQREETEKALRRENLELTRRLNAAQKQNQALLDKLARSTLESSDVTGNHVFEPSDYRTIDD
jgi:ABC-type phosphate transport system auxiliary subunit